MKLTHNWIKEQIVEVTKLIGFLEDSEDDNRLRTIWNERVNTLQSTLKVVDIEMRLNNEI